MLFHTCGVHARAIPILSGKGGGKCAAIVALGNKIATLAVLHTPLSLHK